MTSPRHERVKQIFLAVCELSSEQRGRFLDNACSGDEALREEVISLLDFHDGEASAAGRATDPFPPLTAVGASAIVGPYRIVRSVGIGGMGEVYEAEQQHPVRRRVAVKLVKWGMDTREVVARFESERQALALMDHPNIARVYEAGATDEGRPYFAMEYVSGVAITEYCDMHRLSTRDRLRLYLSVCDAVQHAHRKGIIHRDLKPSNILVTVQDDSPIAKIIDFGVAKATSQRLTERTLFTELGQWIGTPEYMSPEQAEMTGLDIDTRTDVYSLGVVLYELLAGVQPFDSAALRSAGFDEMRRRIREDEPPRPSTRVSSLGAGSRTAARLRQTDAMNLVRELRGDLDWIVMRAIEKDRTRRYDSPAELADDVRRYLSDQPVEASPPSTTYRVRKFVRRNRMAVAAGLLVLAALVIGVVGTTLGLVQARREAATANQVADFIEGLLADLDPSLSGRLPSYETILEQGVERIDRELGDQPLVQSRLLRTLGNVYLSLGLFEEGKVLFQRSLDLRRGLLGDEHPDVAASLNDLAWYHYRTADFETSQRLYEEVLAIHEQHFGAGHPIVARDLSHLARAHWMRDELDAAQRLYERALAIESSAPSGVTGGDPTETLHWYGILLLENGRYREARQVCGEVVSRREALFGVDHPAVGWALTEYGRALTYLGDYQPAEVAFRRSWRILEDAFGEDSSDVAFPMSGLATMLRTVGRFDESRRLYERALEIREQTFGPVHNEVLWTVAGYGWALLACGELDAAEAAFERTIELSGRLFPNGHYLEGYGEMGLGAVLAMRDDPAARRHLERSVKVVSAIYSPDNLRMGWPLLHLGNHLREQGDCAAARPLLEQAVAVWRSGLGEVNIVTAEGILALARWEDRCGDGDLARRLLDEATQISDRIDAPEHPIVAGIQEARDQLVGPAGPEPSR